MSYHRQKLEYSQFTNNKESGIEYPLHTEVTQYNPDTSILITAVMDISSCRLNILIDSTLFQGSVSQRDFGIG